MVTTNKSLIQQTYNTSTGNTPANQVVDPAWISTPYSNWSVAVNYDFGAIDLAMGGSVAISVTGVVTNQSMVLSQYQPLTIIFSGVLSANIAYALPSSVGGLWAVYNNTTGAFNLSMSTPAGTNLSVVIPSGGPYMVTCNATTGISIPPVSLTAGSVTTSIIANGAVTAAKLFGTTGTGNVVLSDSAVLTGTPTAPTATAGTNTTQLATTAFVAAAVTAGSGGTGRLLRAPQILTSGTSYTTPAGCNSIYVECVGGGGYGGFVTNNGAAGPRAGGGGGAGAYCAKLFSVSPSTAYSYVIGAGGIAATSTNGNPTTFTVGGTTITAGRGLNGSSPIGPGFGLPGAGGTATNGDINATGNPGGMGSIDANEGGSGPGGGSFFGGGGLPAKSNIVGKAGAVGGGGSGACSIAANNVNGGDGGAGIIRVWEFS